MVPIYCSQWTFSDFRKIFLSIMCPNIYLKCLVYLIYFAYTWWHCYLARVIDGTSLQGVLLFYYFYSNILPLIATFIIASGNAEDCSMGTPRPQAYYNESNTVLRNQQVSILISNTSLN